MSDVDTYLHSEPDETHLSYLLLSTTGASLLPGALEDVAPEDFYDTHLGEMWRTARDLVSAGRVVSKRALLEEHDSPARRDRLERISGQAVHAHKIPGNIRTVLDTAKLRRLAQVTDRIRENLATSQDFSTAYEFAAGQIAALDGADLPPDVVTFDQAVLRWEEHQAAPDMAPPIATPWPEVNDMLAGGLHPGRSYLVAGRPGGGKSIACLNIAQEAAEHGKQALVFSVEMGTVELTGRLLAAGARAEYGEIVRRRLSSETNRRVAEYRDSWRGLPLRIVDRAHVSVEFVQAIARTQKRTVGLDVLVVDYLQLLTPSDSRTVREQQVAHISRSLKQLSRELGCVVVTAAQLNRGNAKDGRKPGLSDLRESGSLEQDADVVLMLHQSLGDDGEPTGTVDVIVAKNRTGRTGDVELAFRGHQARLG